MEGRIIFHSMREKRVNAKIKRNYPVRLYPTDINFSAVHLFTSKSTIYSIDLWEWKWTDGNGIAFFRRTVRHQWCVRPIDTRSVLLPSTENAVRHFNASITELKIFRKNLVNSMIFVSFVSKSAPHALASTITNCSFLSWSAGTKTSWKKA